MRTAINDRTPNQDIAMKELVKSLNEDEDTISRTGKIRAVVSIAIGEKSICFVNNLDEPDFNEIEPQVFYQVAQAAKSYFFGIIKTVLERLGDKIKCPVHGDKCPDEKEPVRP